MSEPLNADELDKLRGELAIVVQPEQILLRLLATIDALQVELQAARTKPTMPANRFVFWVETRDSGDLQVDSKRFIIRLPRGMWEYLTEKLPDDQWRGVALHFDWDWWWTPDCDP